MNKILEKQIIVMACLVMLIALAGQGNNSIVSVLIGIIMSETGVILSEMDKWIYRSKALLGVGLIFSLICFALKPLAFFMPVAVYIAVDLTLYPGLFITALGLGAMYEGFSLDKIAVWMVSVFFAGLIAYDSSSAQKYKADYQRVTDSAVELEASLRSKNKELLENQDASIHIATLQERNRIAREIHDNVGHMLSRTILQIGALMTINKQEPLHSQLDSIQVSLNEAMNNIRESVHDLHNDSVDFKAALENVTAEMKSRYLFKLDFDMSEQVPGNVKYCFIAIVKEAMTNIVKYSDATKVSVLVREHPGFYQMIIEDNGTKAKAWSGPGIGLTNMEDRVRGLGGTITFFTENGFKISISVPKQAQTAGK